MQTELVWISDPGHAWLRVPLSDYVASGIKASRFSYVDAAHVYLEEDCDAELYLTAARIPNSPLPFPTETFREIYFADVDAKGNPRHLDRISIGTTKLLNAIRHINDDDETDPDFRGDLQTAENLIREVINSNE